MEKKLEDKFTKDVETILKKQKILDKAIADNSAAITKIDKDILQSSKVKQNEIIKDTTKDKTSEKAIVNKRKKCKYV